MLTIEHPAALRTRALASGVPRITPLHDPLDKRHSDLSFSVDTGSRPRFRVLVARDRALFAPEQAGARNASNFYDSQREGLLSFDGPPCFYLMPRGALHAMLPAPRLYYTLIAYADESGTGAVYAHAPESLVREAPSVTIDSTLTGTLGLMFGTPVGRLLRVDAVQAWSQAFDEAGEDLGGSTPETVGLAADDGEDLPAPTADQVSAAFDDGFDGDEAEPAYAASDEDSYSESDSDSDQDYGYDDGYANAASARAADGDLRPLRQEAASYDDDDGGPGSGAAAYDEPDGAHESYDDGFGRSGSLAQSGRQSAPQVHAYEEQAEDEPYGDEQAGYGDAQAYSGDALREGIPGMLPDEDADGAHTAQAGEHDEDEVDIEASAQAYGDDAGDGYAHGHAQDNEPARVPFDIAACKAILARIMPFESGSEGFARVVDDGEFAGRFGTSHPAYQRFHMGLTFGGFPFVQESGTLGQLLVLMRERDRATFNSLFPEADTMIAVTTAADGARAWQSADGFSQRLRPVGGQRLWQEPWLARFRRAGQHPPFQAAQNELAASLYVQPVIPVCRQIGLDSEQGLAMAIDRAVQMGADGALGWVLECATPVETGAMKQAALVRLGAGDLQTFQAAQKLPPTGTWDVATHAALIAAMRASSNSASPVLGCNEIVAAMLRHAQGTPWVERIKRIRDASAPDRLFQL